MIEIAMRCASPSKLGVAEIGAVRIHIVGAVKVRSVQALGDKSSCMISLPLCGEPAHGSEMPDINDASGVGEPKASLEAGVERSFSFAATTGLHGSGRRSRRRQLRELLT